MTIYMQDETQLKGGGGGGAIYRDKGNPLSMNRERESTCTLYR